MPNGGYPLHLSVLLNELDLVLDARGTEVSLWTLTPVCGSRDWDTQYENVAHFTGVQVDALLFHLLYWRCGGNHEVLAFLAARGLDVRPHHPVAGCRYAY